MIRRKILRAELFSAGLFICAAGAQAADISGTISATLTISENSKLVGDVTCAVTGAPCITFGTSGLTLDLNGYSMTGPGDPLAGCSGNPLSPDAGILVNGMDNVVIRGPGVVQRFRNQGIVLSNSTGATVSGVTISTNCFSGLFVVGGSGHTLEGNVSVGNGAPTAPCGGI
jgi:hypothetical protein